MNHTKRYRLLNPLNFCQEPQVYAHQWRTGDFVIWDNRICLHSAPKKQNIYNTNQERIMHGSSTCNVDCISTWQAFKGALARL